MANFLAITNNTGTTAWRIWPIFNELEKEGHDTHVVTARAVGDQEYEAIMKWADVVIFQMVANAKIIQEMKAKGIYVIFDCDDYIPSLPERHPAFKTTKDKKYQRMFKETATLADVVTVTTDLLKSYFLKFNKNTVVLPNFIPLEFWERPHSPNTSKRLRFGWAGSMGRPDDLEIIAPGVKQLLEDFPNSKFCYIGGGGWNNQQANNWVFGEDSFKDIPYERKEFHPGSKIETWPDTLTALRLDVALAPVADNEFSRNKSSIKAYEYGINRWPGVYTEYLYKDVVKHGETGYLAKTPEDFYKYAKLLLNDGELRRKIGANAYNHVKSNYSFSGNKGVWLDHYRQAYQKSRVGADHLFVA